MYYLALKFYRPKKKIKVLDDGRYVFFPISPKSNIGIVYEDYELIKQALRRELYYNLGACFVVACVFGITWLRDRPAVFIVVGIFLVLALMMLQILIMPKGEDYEVERHGPYQDYTPKN